MFRVFVCLITTVFFLSGTVSARTMSALVIDDSGNVLHQRNAAVQMYPASLTKLMTIYLAFEAISNDKASFDTKLKVSKRASRMPRSKLHLRPGETITLKEALLSLIVKSANDSAVVIAEHWAGSEAKFAEMMNQRAAQLGMSKSHFTNASGLHHSKQKTTAYDMAKLTLAVKRDFPTFYHLFSQSTFFYKNSILRGHNHVMHSLQGARGMKTGYTSKAGWNIITTATRGDIHLVGVILGSDSYRARDIKMVHLMNKQFASLSSKKDTIRSKMRVDQVKKLEVANS